MKRLAIGLAAVLLASSASAVLAAPAMEADTDKGRVLVDENGMTLYSFDKDTEGVTNCYNQCATNWPPLMAADDAQPEGDWTLVERTDGGKMWAFKGMPLYLWVKDEKPGDTTGDGVGGVWHVVPVAADAAAMDAPAMEADSDKGKILVDINGMTLYTFDKDAAGVTNCYDKCATNWPPLMAADDAKAMGEWTLVDRTDGGKMWAYKGMPLYLWVKDEKVGDTTGDGVGGVWHVAKP